MTERFTLPDGIELAYESTGEGPLLVHAHGMLLGRAAEDAMDLYSWDPVRALPGRRFVRYDARGHGESTGRAENSDFTYPAVAQDLLDLIDRLSPGAPVTGMGASLGAATVLTAAALAPERFDRLVLLIPPTAWATRPAQADRYRADADLLDERGIEALAEAWAGAPVPSSLADAPGYPPRSPGVHPEVLSALLRGAARSNLPAHEALAALPQPTLILAWADDPGHPVSTAEELAEVMPGARLHISTDAAGVRTWGERIAAFLGG
ncbi:alpha/beta fold hydrolase [Streptomyces sp. RFCAC02]|uniref:alpha/beta fold hydrolase n=1 Tax=Streptomyces sp. RFCAC02 TaxID=2499143 RepID=UPI0010211746|nr:alpha/beta fold hydrolase [Streptomyces sp. RFCAC02]